MRVEGRGRVEVDRVAKIMALGTMLYTKVGTSRQRIGWSLPDTPQS